MGVAYDLAKDAENVAKHGISLARAADFDFDVSLIEVDDSQDFGEVRYNAIGWLDARLHSLTFYRDRDRHPRHQPAPR